MSARMAGGMAMSAETGMAKMTDTAVTSDCMACPKDAGGIDNPMHCPPSCIAPVLAVLPQGLAVTMVPQLQQPAALATPFLRGRSFLPDPFPPRPSDLI